MFAYNWSAVGYARNTSRRINASAAAAAAPPEGEAAAGQADDDDDDDTAAYLFEDIGDDWIEADAGGDAALDDRIIDQNPALRARHAGRSRFVRACQGR